MPSAAVAQSYQFSSIEIDGNVRVDDSTILSVARIGVGQTVTAAQVSAAFGNLTASGLFESVELTPRGNSLLIEVVEYPVIGVVNFEGNRRIDDEVLAEAVQVRAGRVLSPNVIEADARAIAELYAQRGRTAAEVTPQILPRGNNRVDLAFVVREGDVVEIERLSFVGNRAFSSYRLRNVLNTKQAGILRRVIQRDTFVAERIALDRQLLSDFYLARGYIDFEILSVTPELARERDRFFLTFNLREGEQFRFGEVSVVSEVDGIDPADYERELRVRPGDIFAPSTLEMNIARMESLAESRGLRFIRAEPRFTRDNTNGRVDVEFAIVRGERIFVERIDIQGNTTTRDEVIRRQFRVAEGDPLNPRKIREAAERIRALGYFADSSVEPRAGSTPDQAIVDVEVEETTTGSLGFSVSYGAQQGIGFGISFAEQNFLGRGQQFAASFNTVKGSRDISVSFTEPALLGRDLAYSFSLGYRETSSFNANFDTREAFLNNSLGFPVSEYGRLTVRQGLLAEKLTGLQEFEADGVTRKDSLRLIDDQVGGTSITGTLGFTYTHDTRNRGVDPSRGWIFSWTQDLGVGNQNRRFLKSEARVGYEMAVLNENVTLKADGRVGLLHMIDGQSRYRDRFQLANVMRGFAAGDSGPRDFASAANDVLGGTRYAVVSLEAQFPLGLPEEYGLSGGVFADIGSVWGVDGINGRPITDINTSDGTSDSASRHLRATLGVSLFWDSPLGPLRFDVSRPLKKQPYDESQNFDFSIVSTF
ncbi:outer membrane protein assembly factor BamA [Roseibaca sp. V10]|uniref:Outer membrane protein assembly factor BamA n=1 Tax=Roseinatronobacter domitianus TaxID=2940293 RepID=A0ABT0M0U9_9RHOB|nr:outer membrane protein assembly factor BamA [Roseibaca domitiana]